MDYEQEYEIWYLSLNVQFEDRTEKVVVKSIPQTITRSVFFISLPPYPGIHMWSGFDNSSYRYLAQHSAMQPFFLTIPVVCMTVKSIGGSE